MVINLEIRINLETSQLTSKHNKPENGLESKIMLGDSKLCFHSKNNVSKFIAMFSS